MLFIAVLIMFFSINVKNKDSVKDNHPSEVVALENERTIIKSSPEDGYIVTYAGINDGIKTLEVSNSYPSSRVRALNWIRAQGFDLNNTRVIFTDFNNPLNDGEE